MSEARRKKSPKYDTSALPEDSFQPGSRGRVLANLLGIRGKREMDEAEAVEYVRAFEEASEIYGMLHRFTAQDLCSLHQLWLGTIYPWAGEYRSVNVSKGGFPFAAARLVPALMTEFEKKILSVHTPCRPNTGESVAQSLALVHAELILIHPFRDGNGRVARLIAVLMGLQAGLPPLDFGGVTGETRERYFGAVRAAMGLDYRPMTAIFSGVISRSLR